LLPKAGLRDLEFGAILSKEQIDVRRFLLADSPIAPPHGGAPDFHESPITSHDFFHEVFPWLH
jgi:hypothetical protein